MGLEYDKQVEGQIQKTADALEKIYAILHQQPTMAENDLRDLIKGLHQESIVAQNALRLLVKDIPELEAPFNTVIFFLTAGAGPLNTDDKARVTLPFSETA